MTHAVEDLVSGARARRLSRVARVSIYGAALAALAAVLFFTQVHGRPALSEPELAWWVIAVAWVIAESCVVHLHFKHSAHSFSLADIPFVFGLVFATGDAFLAGALVGAGIAYALRKLPFIKLAFNLAQLALAACVAFVIVRGLAVPGADIADPRTWLSLYVATLATGALTIACIAGAISIAEGGMNARTVRQMFAMDLMVTAANSSIAIAAAVMIATEPRVVPVLIVPALIVFAIYRAYISERQRHEKLEFLYEANRALTRSPEVADAIEGVLARSREAFRSEIAEIVLYNGNGTPLRTTHGPGAETVTMVEANRGAAEAIAALIDTDRPVVSLEAPYEPGVVRSYLEQRGIRHAMVAMLPGENGIIGTVMLANRFGFERGYREDDLRLLELLANNASVALQYDRLEHAINKLRDLQAQLHHQAYHDPLTGLPNRSLFMERVRDELARRDGTIAVLFIDVDDFKLVNDSLGHGAGDALLVSVAGRLRHSVRPQDVVARIGGDEFAVMLPDIEDSSLESRNVARRMLDALETPVNAGGGLVSVRLSIGITTSRHSRDADALIREADLAMYQAKAKGKRRFEFFDPSMAAAMLRRRDLTDELARAIEREEIEVHYQPIVSLESGRPIAAEALVRWRHPDRGLVGPCEFIPLAEETRLIRDIGRHVLADVCRQARGTPGDAPQRLHVNLSVAELRDPNLLADVRTMLEESGTPPAAVALEITESEVLADADGSGQRLAALRALGVRIVLDDFGTGYSSLSYLHSLPLDCLKIAKPFVDALASRGRESRLIAIIVELARTLELDVIAEGIETPAQLVALRELGVEFGQGFLLGRPAAPDARFRRGTAVALGR
jgi:diguanylate cyclase (GGDEF)-like protein